MIGFTMKNMEKKQIWLKLLTNLCIFKLFNFYVKKLKYVNEFDIPYKNNLLILNLLFKFFFTFSFLLFSSLFFSLAFSLEFTEPNMA